MPNCFQLTRKGESEAFPLGAVDSQLVWHFRAANDEKYWYADWYNVIGFMLACGSTFKQVRVKLDTWTDDAEYRSQLVAVCEYLDANFTANAWAEIGRR